MGSPESLVDVKQAAAQVRHQIFLQSYCNLKVKINFGCEGKVLCPLVGTWRNGCQTTMKRASGM